MADTNTQMVYRSTVKRWLRKNARPKMIDDLIDAMESSDDAHPRDIEMLRSLRFEMSGELSQVPRARAAGAEP